jgi:DNA-binding CsgD family transcriptional regulator
MSEAHLERLGSAHRRLRGCRTVGALFATAAELARADYGFERGLVLSVTDGWLTAGETDVLTDAQSDRLRRRILAEPQQLFPDTAEAELVRLAATAGPPTSTAPSALAEKLELAEYAFGLVAPETRALALLVVYRPKPPVDGVEGAAITALAQILAGTLEHVVLRSRVTELANNLRHFSAFNEALMTEILTAPVSLPTDRGHRNAFPLLDAIEPGSSDRMGDLLTERESRIALLLVEGRTNREIAEELFVSPETVKSGVARILRKLGAANRVEAVTRILRLSRS